MEADSSDRFWARTSVRLGIASMGLCMAGPITFFFSFWLALPVATFALWAGREGWMTSQPGTASRAYAKAGLTSGLIGLVGALLYFLMVVLCFTMWIGLILLDEL